MEVQGFEATLHYPVEKNGKTDFQFLNGTLLTAGWQQPVPGSCLLLHKHLLQPGAEQAFLEQHHLRTVTPDSPALQDFLLCAEHPEQVPQAVCRHLALLAQAAPVWGRYGWSLIRRRCFWSIGFIPGVSRCGNCPTRRPSPPTLCRNGTRSLRCSAGGADLTIRSDTYV